MDLPEELRLMVYDCLPRGIVHTRLDMPAHEDDLNSTLILVARTYSMAISRAIHE